MDTFHLKGVGLKCVSCDLSYEFDPYLFFCPKCGGLLEVTIENPGVSWSLWRSRKPGVWRYREALPVPKEVEVVSIREGGTRLVEAHLDDIKARIMVKFEGSNPTGSFKDRGMTVGVTIAKALNARVVVAASTGNTAASLAAYAARARLKAIVVLPRGGVAQGKLLQAILHGAVIAEVYGSFDNAMKLVLETSKKTRSIYPLNSFNPIRLEGQKTIAYEIVEELNATPDYIVVPVGNGGNIAAIWKGFRELYEWGLISELPKMVGVQAEGASPLARAWEEGSTTPVWTDKPTTIASAIRIGKPVNWLKAFRAVRESEGFFLAVSDNEIATAQKVLASRIGLGVEASSAAPLAALWRMTREGVIDKSDKIVLVATGHALKDPDAIQLHKPRVIRIETSEHLLEIIAGELRRWSG